MDFGIHGMRQFMSDPNPDDVPSEEEILREERASLADAAKFADKHMAEQVRIHGSDAWLELECAWCGHVTKLIGARAVEACRRYSFATYDVGADLVRLNTRIKIEGYHSPGCKPPASEDENF